MNAGGRGIQWFERLEDIDSADDLALMVQRARDMDESFRRIVKYAGQVGTRLKPN